MIVMVLSVLRRIRRESVETTSKKLQFDDYISLSIKKLDEDKRKVQMTYLTERRGLERLKFKSKDDIRVLLKNYSDIDDILRDIHSIAMELDDEEFPMDWNAYTQAAQKSSRAKHLLEQRYQHTFGTSIEDEDKKIIFQKGTPFSNN